MAEVDESLFSLLSLWKKLLVERMNTVSPSPLVEKAAGRADEHCVSLWEKLLVERMNTVSPSPLVGEGARRADEG